jgi:hypothetical protein
MQDEQLLGVSGGRWLGRRGRNLRQLLLQTGMRLTHTSVLLPGDIPSQLQSRLLAEQTTSRQYLQGIERGLTVVKPERRRIDRPALVQSE